ncbi:DNA-binding MarR family transcriptional regulator [Microbacterium sp. AK009]|uniref:MarR family winged helix-turn-helix transcriptional regulator n=1 Tax=Microbacterium sp. AK009 TaxID=2723068 RepID=UPI0015C9420D|nr:MarR family winged helix-turn-helix transcriptional regulator [Microbacterium sp. AK009]NYF16695.1 DNA-binding MarR family transcriptional regulator [Microbacterium sp. AK009]
MTLAPRDAAIGRVLEGVIAVRRVLGVRRRPFAQLHLSSSQLEALYLIAHSSSPVTPGGLAARLGVTPGAVTQLVEGLKRVGLVAQRPHPDDARSRTLWLTDAARREVDGFEAQVIDDMRGHLSELSDAEVAELGRLLHRVGGDG